MKIFVYNLMAIYFMLNVTFTNSFLPEEPLIVQSCVVEIENTLGSKYKQICFTNMFYFHENNKPIIPLITMESETRGLDMMLSELVDWVKYAFYLGERVTFDRIKKPTRFCRTLYLNNDIIAKVMASGNLVYPRIYEDENKNVYKMLEVIILRRSQNPDALFGYDNVTPEVIAERQKCLRELNNLNLYDHMSEKDLFNNLYRMSGIQPLEGIQNNENASNINLYSKHFHGKTILLEGTLDALPFCRKRSVFDALNNLDNNITTNVPLNDNIVTLDLINTIRDRGESSSQRDRSRSSPTLLNLFPSKNDNDI